MSGCYLCGSPEGNVAQLCPRCNELRYQSPTESVEDEISPDEIVADAGSIGGFWLRASASLIDIAIMAFLQSIVAWIYVVVLRNPLPLITPNFLISSGLETSNYSIFLYIQAGLTVCIFFRMLAFVYRPMLEASTLQATPGKIFLRLIVNGEDGVRIDLSQAFMREVVRGLWLLPLLAIEGISFVLPWEIHPAAILFAFLASLIIIGIQGLTAFLAHDGAALQDSLTVTHVILRSRILGRELPVRLAMASSFAVGFFCLSYFIHLEAGAPMKRIIIAAQDGKTTQELLSNRTSRS